MYTTFLLPKAWFRVLLVLVVAPVLVLEAALWTLILKFYLRSHTALILPAISFLLIHIFHVFMFSV